MCYNRSSIHNCLSCLEPICNNIGLQISKENNRSTWYTLTLSVHLNEDPLLLTIEPKTNKYYPDDFVAAVSTFLGILRQSPNKLETGSRAYVSIIAYIIKEAFRWQKFYQAWCVTVILITLLEFCYSPTSYLITLIRWNNEQYGALIM